MATSFEISLPDLSFNTAKICRPESACLRLSPVKRGRFSSDRGLWNGRDSSHKLGIGSFVGIVSKVFPNMPVKSPFNIFSKININYDVGVSDG